MGAETILAIGGLAGAGISAASAIQQNRAAQRAKDAAGQAAAVQSRQVAAQADLERLKTLRRSAQVRARLRLAGAEAGLGDFGSIDLLEQQNALDTSLNLDILRQNERSLQARIGSELNVDMARLSSQYRNTILSSFEGALGGAQTGLSIAGGLKELGRGT